MLLSPDQILTVAQMREAEQALIDAGTSVEALMDIAGRGAGEWVWRISGARAVTVLCGPGNNGGDGWVIAELIRARGVAQATGAVVLLKGPDSLIAAPDGTIVLAPAAPSWLSVAGSGDVLAGVLASRLAVHGEPLRAAEEALWLHGEAARIAGPAFTAGQLGDAVQGAMAGALS